MAAAFSLDNCPEDVYLMNVRRGLFFGFTVAGLLRPPAVSALSAGGFFHALPFAVHLRLVPNAPHSPMDGKGPAILEVWNDGAHGFPAIVLRDFHPGVRALPTAWDFPFPLRKGLFPTDAREGAGAHPFSGEGCRMGSVRIAGDGTEAPEL